jgi:hypothetical protein
VVDCPNAPVLARVERENHLEIGISAFIRIACIEQQRRQK